MVMSTENQAYIFLAIVYWGLIIGVIYDIYRMVRRILKPGKWITGIMDLFFWIIIAILSSLMLFHINSGEVRVYAFIGLALGWSLYFLTLSYWIMKAFDIVYRAVCTVVIWPVKKIKSLLKPLFIYIKKKFSKGIEHSELS